MAVVAISGTSCSSPAAVVGTNVESLPELQLVEEIRLGSVGGGPLGFTRIGGVAVDSDGRTYVLESNSQEIRIFDPHGEIQRVIGGSGSGPGEFARISAFGVTADTLWASDGDQARVTLFALDGNVIRTRLFRPVTATIENPPLRVIISPAEHGVDGLWRPNRSTMAFSYDMHPQQDTFPVPLLTFDLEEQVVDTVGFRHYQVAGRSVQSGNLRVPAEWALPGDPITDYRPSKQIIIRRPVATADRLAAFSVTWLMQPAETLFHTILTYVPRPVESAFVENLARKLSRGPGEAASGSGSGLREPGVVRVTPQVTRALRRIIPRFHPPVSHAIFGEGGEVWLQREWNPEVHRTWIILEPDGRARGQLRLSDSVEILWLGGDRVWIVVPDEFDVPWLIRYHVADLDQRS